MLRLVFLIQYQSVNHLQSFSLLTLIKNLLVSLVTSPYLAILFLQLILPLISVSLVLKLNSIPIPMCCLSSIAYTLCPLTLSLLYKMLFFCFLPPYNAATSCRVPFLPKSLVPLVLRTCHDHSLSGQFGVHRTLTHILSRFWWPNMYQSVQSEFITILSPRNLMVILNLFQFPSQYFKSFICICGVPFSCLHLVEIAM